jgi:DNA-directed RNA polymerase specialized sigma24 family protein
MKNFAVSAPSQEGDFVSAFLEEYDVYIQSLVRTQFPFAIFTTEIVDLEIDEMVQLIRIKLWMILQNRPIHHPKSYIGQTVHTMMIDTTRKRRHFQLPVNDDGELNGGTLLITPGQGMRDPSYEIDAQDVDPDTLRCIAATVEALPARQQYALICRLKDTIDDAFVLVDVLQHLAVDPETVHWPKEDDEKMRLKASLSVARKKLQCALSENRPLL